MISQVIEMSRGWPLGLEIMHIKLRQTQPVLEPMPSTSSFLHLPSASLSSASSSSSEKKSTSSFFDDGSVTLGRLIGIRARSVDKKEHHDQHRISCRGEGSTETNRSSKMISARAEEASSIRHLLGSLLSKWKKRFN
ncbi:hypothetical protein QQ045_009272 [Rhodiola kirilowii]